MKFKFGFYSFLFFMNSCAMRNYTYYLVDVPVEKNESLKDDSNAVPLRPAVQASNAVMKVRWNDGVVFTEVDVPMLVSGQNIVIEQGNKGANLASGDKSPAVRGVLLPPPTKADKSLSEAYKERGLKENASAPEISISRAKTLLQDALKSGNYALALDYAESALTRYPSHPDFLRAKGSILLLMGEKEKAIEIYEMSEEIESDPKVKAKLLELRKSKSDKK